MAPIWLQPAIPYLYNYNGLGRRLGGFAVRADQPENSTAICGHCRPAVASYGDDSGPMGWRNTFAYTKAVVYHCGDKRIIEVELYCLMRKLIFLQSKPLTACYTGILAIIEHST